MDTETLVIDNFRGSMTAYMDGDINSGFSYVTTVSGQNPFVRPGNLTWSNTQEQINSSGTVITDLIMAGKERVENGVLYVYAIGHTGRLYKIQVNDPNTFNPDYDNPVLLTTLSAESPTFTRGGSMDFYGTSQKIYIGHDKGVTSIEFDGTGEAFVGALGSWTQTVPRPLKQFIGNLYVGNGSNIAEITVSGTVTSYTKLSPGFPSQSQVRDMDVSPAGDYMDIVVSQLALGNITVGTQDTSITSNSGSYIFKWNGIDVGYTSFSTFPSFSLSSNIMFGPYQYTFGYDQFGAAAYNPINKLLSLQEVIAPLPNAISSTGNLVSFISPLYFDGVMEADLIVYGSMDFEVGPGYWDIWFMNATSPETDIVQVPFQMTVSNFGYGASSNGYADNIFGTAKIYFSTLETSSGPTTAYRFYKLVINTSPSAPSGTAMSGAVYQTQNQLFSKKVKISEVRVYGEPWVADNSFTIDLIGSSGNPISGGSKTFTAGSNLTIGDDFAWYTPDCAPTYALGVRITNEGSANHIITKIEIDISGGGK